MIWSFYPWSFNVCLTFKRHSWINRHQLASKNQKKLYIQARAKYTWGSVIIVKSLNLILLLQLILKAQVIFRLGLWRFVTVVSSRYMKSNNFFLVLLYMQNEHNEYFWMLSSISVNLWTMWIQNIHFHSSPTRIHY